jgi:hypothetical protein
MPTKDATAELSAQIRAELSDRAPEGFHFTDHLIRQDAALERLTEQLRAHPDVSEVERAVGRAVSEEKDGWTLLKLFELVERLTLTGTSASLMQLASEPPGDGPRSRFLAGRACEVLLQLPLDYETRTRANEICKLPLDEIARFRMGAQRERTMQRPRRVEWIILAIVMLLALAGLGFALFALER